MRASSKPWRCCLAGRANTYIATGALLAASLLSSATAAEELPAGFAVRDELPATKLLSDRAFRDELNAPLAASWANSPLRTVLERLSEVRGIAIVLDRRVDPTTPIDLQLQDATLLSGLQQIAYQVGAGVSVLPCVVYVGPIDDSRKLATLVELRANELFDLSESLAKGRHFELGRRRRMAWGDLTTPEELFEQLSTAYELDIANAATVPHDLLRGNTLPDVNFVEAASLLAVQWGLTWTWGDATLSIVLIPIPQDVLVDREYRVRPGTESERIAAWKEDHPDLEATASRGRVVVSATVETHEKITAANRGPRRAASRPEPATEVPLRRRQFTLKVERTSPRQIMAELTRLGITFDYDEQAFADAEVDLDRPIAIDVIKTSAEEFLGIVFAELPIAFTIDDKSVTLELKSAN